MRSVDSEEPTLNPSSLRFILGKRLAVIAAALLGLLLIALLIFLLSPLASSHLFRSRLRQGHAERNLLPRNYAELDSQRLRRIPKAARHLRRQATAAMATGHYNEALELLRQELERTRGVERVGTLGCIADCYRRMEQFDSALGAYAECRVLAESLADTTDLSSAYAEMGQVFAYLCKYERAESLFEYSLSLVEKTQDYWNTTAAYLNLAGLYYNMGHYQKSRLYAGKALALALRQRFEEFEAIASSLLTELQSNAVQDESSSTLKEPGKPDTPLTPRSPKRGRAGKGN